MNAVNRLSSYTAGELLQKTFEPRKHILFPWFKAAETAIIWAPSGVGKTWMSLCIALAAAGGGSFGDWSTPEPMTVLYIDGEMHQEDLQERIAFLLDTGAVEVADREATLANVRIIARQAQEVGQPFYDLTKAGHQRAILEQVQGRVDLLILDNLSTMSDGLGDENASSQFKPLQPFFMQLKQAGVATILVHHSNKSGTQLRGSSALETTFEIILGLLRPDNPEAGHASFVARFTKFRGKEDRSLQPRTWRLTQDGWEITGNGLDDPYVDPVVQALKSMRYTTQNEIADALGLDKTQVSKRLKSAVTRGILKEGEAKAILAEAKKLRGNPPEAEEAEADEVS